MSSQSSHPEKTGPMQANRGQFKPGQSGNPAGKPKGARHKATQIVEKLMQAGAKEITEAIVTEAKAGNIAAARLVIERLAPAPKDRAVSIVLPDTGTAEGVAQAQRVILEAVAAGEVTPSEAATLAGIVEARRKAIETEEILQRLAALEEQHEQD